MSAESTNNKDICNSTAGKTDKNNLLDNYNDKVPNYLNLACCVNGYSNLTTYDSKIRQDINKSREVSPIRPSTSSIQYCKQSNLLTPPTLLSLNDIDVDIDSIRNTESNTSNNKNSYRSYGIVETTNGKEKRQLSFIQQRVELLYGPQALSQVIYTPNKGRKSVDGNELIEQKSTSNTKASLKETHNGSIANTHHMSLDETDKTVVELPVFRHLSAQFRSQLPKLSPKRQINSSNGNNKMDEIDNANQRLLSPDAINIHDIQAELCAATMSATNGAKNDIESITTAVTTNKDGHYFLKLLKSEQARLLVLADEAEKIINELLQNPETSEDTLGLLRSASGKARLLVSQKMKQFEGLCLDNINPNRSGEKFHTTTDDLLGFWDMVKLQVDNVDSIFEEITALKQSNWQKSTIPLEVRSTPNAKQQFKPAGKALNKNTESKANITPSVSALKREQQRKQLLEMKRKNKLAMSATKSSSPDNMEDDVIVANKSSTKSIEIFVKTPTSI